MPELELSEPAPRALNNRAPDVFRPGGWTPMRTYSDDEPVDFAIVGAGAGALACKLAEYVGAHLMPSFSAPSAGTSAAALSSWGRYG